jgi:LacI family transcriptional regulator, galactose operon repressor
MRPTIRDVARQLKLSITTVSRALDGYDDVADETRKLVIKTAEEMGYIPNRAARQLRRQRTDTIGYILPSDEKGFSDPFFSEFIAGLGDEASTHNYDLLVSAAAFESEAEKSLYRRWVQGAKIDGMVINRVHLKDWRLQFLTEQNMPHVQVECSLEQSDFVGIEVDSQTGFIELLKYLEGKGHRRIGFIGADPELKIDHDRQRAYLAGLKAAGLKADPKLMAHANLTSAAGYEEACYLLEIPSPPTAIVCISDQTAIGAMHAANERGLIIGRDIAIAGFDGLADSAHTQPPLTTLEQPVYSMARQLVTMLLALINGGALTERQVKIEPKLLIRGSTGG